MRKSRSSIFGQLFTKSSLIPASQLVCQSAQSVHLQRSSLYLQIYVSDHVLPVCQVSTPNRCLFPWSTYRRLSQVAVRKYWFGITLVCKWCTVGKCSLRCSVETGASGVEMYCSWRSMFSFTGLQLKLLTKWWRWMKFRRTLGILSPLLQYESLQAWHSAL